MVDNTQPQTDLQNVLQLVSRFSSQLSDFKASTETMISSVNEWIHTLEKDLAESETTMVMLIPFLLMKMDQPLKLILLVPCCPSSLPTLLLHLQPIHLHLLRGSFIRLMTAFQRTMKIFLQSLLRNGSIGNLKDPRTFHLLHLTLVTILNWMCIWKN